MLRLLISLLALALGPITPCHSRTDSGSKLCIATDLFPCDGPQATALNRLLITASISEITDLSTLALLQDEPYLVAGRAGMIGLALSRADRDRQARSFLSAAKTHVFFSQNWVANAMGLLVLARYRKALGDPAAKDTLISTTIDWPNRFTITDRVLYLRELGFGLAQIGEDLAALEEFERARHEVDAAPASPERQENDAVYALVQLWDYTRSIDGFTAYAKTLEALIVEKLSVQSGNRRFWPKTPTDLER
jgi:hypothetical protein